MMGELLKTLLRCLYHVVVQVPAQHAIQRMVADGLPAELVPAFRYLAHPNVATGDKRILEPIKSFRAALRNRSDPPLGAVTTPPPQPGDTRHVDPPPPGPLTPVSWEKLANNTCVSHYWGVFLFLCAKHKRAQTVLELGSGVGISACYLTAGNPNAQLITVEGSPGRAAIAAANLRAMNPRPRVVNAMFDSVLDEWLPRLSGTLDIVHIDGQHERVSTLHYFERIKPHLSSGALVIFDDIHWSDDMSRAWDELARSRDVSFAVNTGRYGICFCQPGAPWSRVHDFSRYTTDWRKEKRPRNELL